MSLLDECESFFGTRDLYEAFGLTKTATAKDIKKAYHKLSLKTHPDKVESDSDNRERVNKIFQTVSKIYYTLSDKDKRKLYDETGNIDLESQDDQQNWKDYFSFIFPQVTIQDIIQFTETYRESEEEKNDLKELYLKHKGNVNMIINYLMCYTIDDEDRYKSIIDEMIKKKEVPVFKAFLEGTSKRSHLKRRKMAAKEATECEELRKEMGLDGTDSSLVLALAKKNSERADFLANLEAKYCTPSKKTARKGKK